MSKNSIIEVIVSGAAGRMGCEVCRAVFNDPDLILKGAVDPSCAGRDVGELCLGSRLGLSVEPSLEIALTRTMAQVLVDFSTAGAVLETARTALKSGLDVIIGTTGLGENELDQLHELSESSGRSVLIAPNFAIGAVLMMRFAQLAAEYLPQAEIIELHHDQKKDAPSGTAILTAKLIRDAMLSVGSPGRLTNSNGACHFGIPIHSVRLPGLVAHQEVIFGGLGQTLSIRHDSISRESFMPGVLLAIKKIGQYRGLIYGLDQIL